jgi:hypothetical protein
MNVGMVAVGLLLAGASMAVMQADLRNHDVSGICWSNQQMNGTFQPATCARFTGPPIVAGGGIVLAVWGYCAGPRGIKDGAA